MLIFHQCLHACFITFIAAGDVLQKENLYKTWHHQCSGKDNTDIIILFRTIFGKDPSNHMQHHCNYLKKGVLWWFHPSIRAWQRPGMPGLAGSMFNFRRTAGREDSRVDKEREVLNKSQPKMRQQMATGNKQGEVSGCFRPWELLFFSKSEKTWSCKASVAKAAATWLRWSTVGWDQVFCKAWHKGCNKFRQDMAATQRWDEWRTVNRCG